MENLDSYNEVKHFFARFGAVIFTAFVSIMAKVSNEILMRRKLSFMAWLAIIGVSLFWAWMGGLFCAWMEYDVIYSSIIVGLTTLLGEKINIYLSQNYRRIFDNFLSIFQKKK